MSASEGRAAEVARARVAGNSAALAVLVEALSSPRKGESVDDHAVRATLLRGCIPLLRSIADRGVQVLAGGLEAYFAAGGDLEAHLGLRPSSGRRSLATLTRAGQRNADLRRMAESLPGTTTAERARSLRAFLLRTEPKKVLSERQLERILGQAE